MANGIKLSSVVGGGSVGFKHNNPTANYEITLPNENIAMPMMRLSTAKASTSGTFIDFTDVPSWAKKITVMFDGVSTNGSGVPIIQLGTSVGFETSGYLGGAEYAGVGANFTTGFGVFRNWVSTYLPHGAVEITSMGNNLFVEKGVIALSNTNSTGNTAGAKTLAGALTQIRITTVNGTDLFDAGSINVLYEGY